MRNRKRIRFLALTLLLMLTLCACVGSDANSSYVVVKRDIAFTVDQAAGTIDDGVHTYHFTINPYSSDGYKAEITYPNGATYYWTKSGNTGHGGWSGDYDDTTYVDGGTLMDVIEEGRPRASDPKPWGIALLLLAVGIFNVAAPRTAWFLEYGWRYKDAEPSELALGANRLGGVIAIIAAVLALIFG